MNPIQTVNQALQLLSRGQVEQAAKLSAQLLSDAPGHAPVHYLACEVAMARNQAGRALQHINKAIEADSREPELKFKKAQIELLQRQGLEAQNTASATAAENTGNPMVQLNAAKVFSQCDNHAGAETFLLKAGALNPRSPDILFEFAKNQFYLGKTLEAEQAIADFLALRLAANGPVLYLRSRLQKQTREHNHVQMLKDYLARQLPNEEATHCYFALAKELEDLGEYADSFKALQTGAGIQRKLIRFNLADELGNIENLINTFQPAAFAGAPESSSPDAPIFIVGLPRTGTTLVERIIARLGGIKSAGETYDFTLAMSAVINQYIAANPGQDLNSLNAALKVNFDDIAEKYINNLRGMFGEAERYVDKLPFNFLYCGLIRKTFPGARIIHLVRDPMDTCYAIYKTLFHQVYHFSYDLDELADYYVAYRRLMDHWHRLMPDTILDVSYEDLVAMPREASKRITDYLGYNWSEALIEVESSVEASSTASAAQVREPIYTSSVQLWRKFEAELEPVRKKLQAANIV